MRNFKKSLLAGAGFALAGCTAPVDQPPYTDPTFGEAVYRNMALQMVNPPPAEVDDLPPSEGNRRALMMLRYQTDKVETPVEESTSSVGD